MVPATNLSLATVGRAKRPQQLGHGTHSGYERAREHQVTRPQTRPHVTMMPCARHRATLRVDVVPQSESSSTGAATEPRHLPQYSQQYTATDGPGAGPSKHLPTSATSHADRPSDRTGSSLRESNTGHRHATHRCHKILQIRRQPRPLSPPKPLVKDWSPLTA